MRLTDYLDKGASLGPEAPCLITSGRTLSYRDVQRLSWRVAWALDRSGVRPGDKVAILSGNDPVAFSCVFGIARAGAVWCPVNPRNEAAENRELLDLFDCGCLIFQAAFASLVTKLLPDLPGLRTLVCLDGEAPGATTFDHWIAKDEDDDPWQADPVDDVVMLVGTGGTTGRPKGVMLTGRNIETMSALTLMSYPFQGRPRYLALAPLTHTAGVLCFPVLTLGGEIVIMPRPDLAPAGSGRVSLAGRAAPDHPYVPAADLDLHAARAPPAARDGPGQPAVPVVRRGPDVGQPPGGGHRRDRPGAGPAVRPDRGADDDLHPGPGRALPRRWLAGHRAAVFGGPPHPAHHGGDHG
jgi:acyl-coenzyme A synthetase/AMP-(fatty) acid ligase